MTAPRDARPFVAHYLRTCGDARLNANGAEIHLLARWVENLPSGDPRMVRIAATDAMGLHDGSLRVGPGASALIDCWAGGNGDGDRDLWLERFSLVLGGSDTAPA